MLEHCSIRPKEFYGVLTSLNTSLSSIEQENLTSASKKLYSSNAVPFSLLFKLLIDIGSTFPDLYKSQVIREFENVQNWLQKIENSMESYFQVLRKLSDMLQSWTEQITIIDSEFEHLLQIAASVVLNVSLLQSNEMANGGKFNDGF